MSSACGVKALVVSHPGKVVVIIKVVVMLEAGDDSCRELNNSLGT
jgi:hypothetical protein